MKKQLVNGLGAAIVAAVMVVLSVPAGAADARCTIPFSFQVNDATLPPGTYSVSTEQSVVFIRGFSRGAMALSNRVDAPDYASPKLVFHRYGDEYILRQVWTGGNSGRQLNSSRREKELASASRRGNKTARFEQVVIPVL